MREFSISTGDSAKYVGIKSMDAIVALGAECEMIPKFPVFGALRVDDRAAVESCLDGFAPYSDFNFVSLMCYNVDDKCRASYLNGNLVVCFGDYLTGEMVLSFLGNSLVPETVRTLIATARDMGFGNVLRMVGEECIRAYADGRWTGVVVREDRGSFDYIHSVRELIGLASPKLRRKRRMIHVQRSKHPEYWISRVDLKDRWIANGVRDIARNWCERRGGASVSVLREAQAINRCLEMSHEFQLVTVGAFARQQLVGFTINEVIANGFYMSHFGKTLSEHRGLMTVLEHETAKIMGEMGCEWLNNQQDLDLPGLRLAKMSWQPSFFLRKYTVEIPV